MNKILFLAMAGVASASFSAASAMAASQDPAAYKAAVTQAKSDYKVAKAQCDQQSGNAKSLCVEQAKATRARSESDAVAQYKNTPKDMEKARVSVADADYSVAKAKCADMSGTSKDSCVADAKNARQAATTNAKSDLRTANANTTTADCDALTGTNKASCLTRTKTASAGEEVADSVITTKVKADLIKEPDLKSLDVHVETNNGVVMLSGFVPSQAEADRAVQLARGVKGVTQVQNNLKLK